MKKIIALTVTSVFLGYLGASSISFAEPGQREWASPGTQQGQSVNAPANKGNHPVLKGKAMRNRACGSDTTTTPTRPTPTR